MNMELFITWGWAILIVTILISLLLFFIPPCIIYDNCNITIEYKDVTNQVDKCNLSYNQIKQCEYDCISNDKRDRDCCIAEYCYLKHKADYMILSKCNI